MATVNFELATLSIFSKKCDSPEYLFGHGIAWKRSKALGRFLLAEKEGSCIFHAGVFLFSRRLLRCVGNSRSCRRRDHVARLNRKMPADLSTGQKEVLMKAIGLVLSTSRVRRDVSRSI